MRTTTALIGVAALAAPMVNAAVFFKDTFETMDAWTISTLKGSEQGKFELSSGRWSTEAAADKGLITSEDAKFYGATALLDKSVNTKDSDVVLQFSLKTEKREYSYCAGGYLKLMPASSAGADFGGDTPYHIMMGPDQCGYDVSRIHAILNHEGDNLLKSEDVKLGYDDKNQFTHLFTFKLSKDNTYEIFLDMESRGKGSILEQWPFPPKTIDDAEDTKPSDWNDEKEIADVTATKPDTWDQPEKIPDPDATSPEDWSEEDDGVWESPQVDNPEYKGEWDQPMIPNPAYSGVWAPKQIANAAYTEDVANFEIGAIGIDWWVVNSGTVLDNVFVGDSIEEAFEFAKSTFEVTKAGEKDAFKVWDDINNPKEEAPDDKEEVPGTEEVETEEAHDEL